MKKILFACLLVTFIASAIAQTHTFESIAFTAGGTISQCAFAPTTLTFNGTNYVCFPGFGTTHTTAAYGDHTHPTMVTSVTGISPVVSSGGTTPAISMARADWNVDGYLHQDDFNAFSDKVHRVTTELPLQCTGGLEPEIHILKSTSIQNGYLSATDWSIFNDKVSSQWEDQTGGISYMGGNVGIYVKDPTDRFMVEGAFNLSDTKSTGSYLSKLVGGAGVTTMAGIYSDPVTPGYNGAMTINHSVIASANAGSYFYYYENGATTYNYKVGIFDGASNRRTFCGIMGGAFPVQPYVNFGSSSYPWGKGFFADSIFSQKISSTGVIVVGNISATGSVGVGTTSGTALFQGESSSGPATTTLISSYPIQSGTTGTQTIGQIDLRHINTSTAYARMILRYNKATAHYEFMQSLVTAAASRNFIYVDMGTGAYQMMSGITTADFANTGDTYLGSNSGSKIGIGTNGPTAKLDLNSDVFRIRTAKTPLTSTAIGNQGDICWDNGFIYICVAANTWRKAALSTW